MIWLTWRQFRTQAVVAAAFLAALAALFVVAGARVSHLYDTSGIVGCHTGCSDVAQGFLDDAGRGMLGPMFFLTTGILYGVPGIVGVFWGAPLIARELETGSYRLVWNQSVTRGRWVAVKLLGVGAASVATAGLLSLLATWWTGPIDRVSLHRITPDVYGARGIVPVGYAAFAFALGVTLGLVVRRTLPAMAITLLVVAALQTAMPLALRPLLAPPVQTSVPLNVDSIHGLRMSDNGTVMRVEARANLPGAWILSEAVVRGDGTPFTGPADTAVCGRDSSPEACLSWIASLNLRQSITYEPAGRFWRLQWRETGLLLAVSAMLAGLCAWWVRRRLT